MNISWTGDILNDLRQQGVRDIVFCPGARNSPIVTVLSRSQGFELHSFFEERDGAFYALGIARRTGRPVAVVTTSGTAAAELLPAAIEAHHTGVPLILLTADRPRRLRGTGAPQAIDQIGLFAKFTGLEFDLELGERPNFETWNRRSNVHLNICFDEPLIDEPLAELVLDEEARPASFAGRSTFAVTAGADWASLKLTKFLRGEGALITVVGTLETDDEREAVLRFLLALGAPVYLESTSGLRERTELRELALRAGDKALAWGLKRHLFSRVLRIGGVPTVRIWRDLDEPGSEVSVFSLSPLPFSGLSRGEMVCAEIVPVLEGVRPDRAPADDSLMHLMMKDRAAELTLLSLYHDEPQAEPSLVHALSLSAPDFVYVGNSLPIREWDLAAGHSRVVAVEANRGVNGIDGQIATFFGLALPGVENWCLIGDLTALYDLAAPWILAQRGHDLLARIVVINNGGGQIFSRIFRNDLFINRHEVSFEAWAKMWSLPYQRWTEIPREIVPVSGVEVVELVPDEAATRRFWDRYDELWN